MSYWTCAQRSCLEQVQRNKYATIKAQAAGWFFLKNGRCYCPQHLPAWVVAWRERESAGRRALAERGLKNGQ